jgi:formylglycine-generating enzyme required for sulfatase activity
VADWTLRKWNLALPAIVTSVQPIESRDWHVNGLGMTMLRIHAGSFTHDTWDSEHLPLLQTVVLTRSFLLSDREISLAQFRQFIADPDYQDEV